MKNCSILLRLCGFNESAFNVKPGEKLNIKPEDYQKPMDISDLIAESMETSFKSIFGSNFREAESSLQSIRYTVNCPSPRDAAESLYKIIINTNNIFMEDKCGKRFFNVATISDNEVHSHYMDLTMQRAKEYFGCNIEKYDDKFKIKESELLCGNSPDSAPLIEETPEPVCHETLQGILMLGMYRKAELESA